MPETPLQARKRKNKAIAKITKRQEVLENIMISEGDKGRGNSAKAQRALKEFQALDETISFIQFRT